MIHVREHVPTFVEGVDPREHDVADIAALRSIPWIRRWEEPMDGQQFFRWSVSQGRYLMAEYDGGRHWYVVGYLSGDPVDLPTWAPPLKGT